MSDEQTQQEGIPADLLAQAMQMPAGVQVEDWNPMETIPTLRVGDDFKEGMTVAGFFEETQELASVKFTKSKTKNAAGVPTSFRHVLRIGSLTGPRLAVWSGGELKVAFEKTTPGTFISLTYKGKGVNAKGNDQHFFDIKRQIPTVQ